MRENMVDPQELLAKNSDTLNGLRGVLRFVAELPTPSADAERDAKGQVFTVLVQAAGQNALGLTVEREVQAIAHIDAATQAFLDALRIA